MQPPSTEVSLAENNNPQRKMTAYQWLLALMLAGVIPFLLLTVMLQYHWWSQSDALAALFSYAAVILTFLGGVQWGIGVINLNNHTLVFKHLFTLSILPSLAAWLLLLINSPKLQLIGFVVSFITVLAIDTLLTLKNIMPRWFLLLRYVVSTMVVMLLFCCYSSL